MSRASELKRLYALTSEQYAAMLEFQDGRCAVCNRKPRARDPQLAVDHDHRTGLVRGLLCRVCNYDLLGRYGDDPVFYDRAYIYLTTPPATQALGSMHYIPEAPPQKEETP